MGLILALAVGLLGYIFLWQPVSHSAVVARAGCWLHGGDYLQRNAEQNDYHAFMRANKLNSLRLDSGEAQGCLPVGVCLSDPLAADRLLGQKILLWRLAAGRDGVGSFLYERLGRPMEGSDAAAEANKVVSGLASRMMSGALGISETSVKRQWLVDAQLAAARRDEATFCLNDLEKLREKLPVGASTGKGGGVRAPGESGIDDRLDGGWAQREERAELR